MGIISLEYIFEDLKALTSPLYVVLNNAKNANTIRII